MRILAYDSGAKRAGWAVVDTGPKFIDAGVIEVSKFKDETYQGYRMRLTAEHCEYTQMAIETFSPDEVVVEIVPVFGMNNFSQGYLANVMATTVHAVAMMHDVTVTQVSAVKVQHAIAVKGNSKNITKPQVRNGVINLLPELKQVLLDDKKVAERADALAIALFSLGYSNTNT